MRAAEDWHTVDVEAPDTATFSKGPPPSSPTKPTNPKDALGSGRVPLHLVPRPAIASCAMVMLHGALKYEPYNWREAGVRATIYVDAMERHIAAFLDGEDLDPDSGQPHIAHVMACAAILLDAFVVEKFIDDRPAPAPTYAMMQELIEDVAEMKGGG